VSDDPLDLAIETISDFRRDQLSEAQQQGKSDFETWLSVNHKAQLQLTPNDIQELISCFSKMFLIKPLPGAYARLKIDLIPDLVLKAEKKNHEEKNKDKNEEGNQTDEKKSDIDIKAYGISSHEMSLDSSVPDPVLWLRLDPSAHNENLENLMTSICSTVLHEMIHLYLMAYCCDAYHDPRHGCTRRGKPLWPKGIGSHHCLAWFHLACAIELEMQKVTGLDVDLAALRSLLDEYNKDGVQIFAPEWERFFEINGWEGACKLFERLDQGSMLALQRHLENDLVVCQIFAEKSPKLGGPG
jgi:hypothetical protein